MATLLEPAVLDHSLRWNGGRRMYAIVFDLDTEALANAYPTSNWNNAYRDIRDGLCEFGFTWQQGSVQFGGPDVTPVVCVLAVQELVRRFSWLAPSVRDIRMLRIEENNDLMPALSSSF
ncbi:MAG TPA: hypothetical protein VFE36_03085 [Candidatus Baltobacteraceae bacterium]|jgi:virulence-associated protein VapD|nr:hypothetical protein [Candidatus Baltobacteraceae bacterium]